METWESIEQSNEGSGILEAAVDDLYRRMDSCRRSHSYGSGLTGFGHAEVVRSRHMVVTTVNAMRGSGITSFSRETMDRLRTVVDWVLSSSRLRTGPWDGEEENRCERVAREMDQVIRYLDSFTEECVLRDPRPSFDHSPVRYVKDGLRRIESQVHPLAS